MSAMVEVEVVSLDDSVGGRRPRPGPGEVESLPRQIRPYRKGYQGQGTKLQTQVPREWRQKVMALAREQGVRESDILRTIVGRALGALVEDGNHG